MTKPALRATTLLAILFFAVAHALCAQTFNVAPMTGGYVAAKPGSDSVNAAVRLTNFGSTAVTDFTYTLYYMDTRQTEGPVGYHLDTPLESGDNVTVEIPIAPGTELGQTDVVLSVPTVNGQNNTTSVNYTYITRYTLNKVPRKRVLMEIHTGLWCPHCPRAHVVLESLGRLYPESFVGIAVHYTDALGTDVQRVEGLEAKWGSGKPSVWCARKNKLGGVDGIAAFENELAIMPFADLDVTATWSDDTHTGIDVTATVEPCITPAEGAEYAVAYVLTANGLTGYNQKCDYSEISSFYYDAAIAPDIAPFPDRSNYNAYGQVTGLTFNHVAVASAGYGNGVEGSLAGSYVPNVAMEHHTTFDDFSRYDIAKNAAGLSVVALLINTQTQQVENAACCDITEKMPASLSDAATDAPHAPTPLYNLGGQKASVPVVPGIYIQNGRKHLFTGKRK